MKAITLRQPWAWAVIFAGKDVENRSWYTHYRGPVAIHAGMGYAGDAPLPRGVRAPGRADLEFGVILGVVDLVDVVEKSRSPWFGGPYGFVLANPRPLDKPIASRGRLGFWDLTPSQARLVAARLR